MALPRLDDNDKGQRKSKEKTHISDPSAYLYKIHTNMAFFQK